jgi:hypothetical protein
MTPADLEKETELTNRQILTYRQCNALVSKMPGLLLLDFSNSKEGTEKAPLSKLLVSKYLVIPQQQRKRQRQRK